MRSKYRAYPKPGWVLKTLVSLVLLALSILLLGGIVSMCSGCWQSPVNSYVVLGFQREHVEFRGGPGSSGSSTNPVVTGHGNYNQGFVKQSNVGYKNPATSISNNLQGELSFPVVK